MVTTSVAAADRVTLKSAYPIISAPIVLNDFSVSFNVRNGLVVDKVPITIEAISLPVLSTMIRKSAVSPGLRKPSLLGSLMMATAPYSNW